MMRLRRAGAAGHGVVRQVEPRLFRNYRASDPTAKFGAFTDPAYLTDLIKIVWNRAKGYKLLVAGSASGELVGALRRTRDRCLGHRKQPAVHARTEGAEKFNSSARYLTCRSRRRIRLVFETACATCGEAGAAGGPQTEPRGEDRLVFGSVTSDMAPALIDRYDLLRGVKKLGTWGMVELFFARFDLSMHRRDCTRCVVARRCGAQGAGPVVRRRRSLRYSFFNKWNRTTDRAGNRQITVMSAVIIALPLLPIDPDRIGSRDSVKVTSGLSRSICGHAAVQHRWFMAPKPPSSDDRNPASGDDPELREEVAVEPGAASRVASAKPPPRHQTMTTR